MNLQTKNARPKKQGEKGQVVQYNAPMSLSNVMLVCPKCSKVTKIGSKKVDNKKRIRQCKKCQAEI